MCILYYIYTDVNVYYTVNIHSLLIYKHIVGKTFTMSNISDQPNPNEYGLIPRICFGLFDALENYSDASSSNLDILITLSHMVSNDIRHHIKFIFRACFVWHKICLMCIMYFICVFH